MPHIIVKLRAGRPDDLKTKLAQELTQALMATLGASEASVATRHPHNTGGGGHLVRRTVTAGIQDRDDRQIPGVVCSNPASLRPHSLGKPRN